jgi:hypothetical protein
MDQNRVKRWMHWDFPPMALLRRLIGDDKSVLPNHASHIHYVRPHEAGDLTDTQPGTKREQDDCVIAKWRVTRTLNVRKNLIQLRIGQRLGTTTGLVALRHIVLL